MRRSKSNPAKYAKNYRSISQRRMTTEHHDDENDDEAAEMERLRQILRAGGHHLSSEAQEQPEARKRMRSKNKSKEQQLKKIQNEDQTNPKESAAKEETAAGILSAELLEEYGSDENPLLSGSKKKKKSRNVQLTPQELKQAAALQKKTARKLQQLETRAAQKRKRTQLYGMLEASKFGRHDLLESTADLGKRKTQKQVLQKLLAKERAGLALTDAERDQLYQTAATNDDEMRNVPSTTAPASTDRTVTKEKKKKRARENSNGTEQEQLQPQREQIADQDSSSSSDPKASSGDMNERDVTTTATRCCSSDSKKPAASSLSSSGRSMAAQMMASLSTLKKESEYEKAAKEEQKRKEEEEEKAKHHKPVLKRYVPADPIEIKTTQSYSTVQPKKQKLLNKNKHTIRQIQRPADVVALRYELPVAAMEFEVTDAIRNHDVVILCAETGSGKSTQVPQFLYENGFSRSSAFDNNESNGMCMIGVTQPRRVAAVSTAKRVCYEMGHGNGQSIVDEGGKGAGNTVAYQTRYETAGLGHKTHIKFMTDGILLQEIRKDLLLRNYGVVVLDEAHERNLNTDVLIGLLSAALPLRKQAALESNNDNEQTRLPPLKVVIMSATLRVQDFTENKNLFPTTIPKVVQVSGRTHPVTVHHSKVTELNDYGK